MSDVTLGRGIGYRQYSFYRRFYDKRIFIVLVRSAEHKFARCIILTLDIAFSNDRIRVTAQDRVSQIICLGKINFDPAIVTSLAYLECA